VALLNSLQENDEAAVGSSVMFGLHLFKPLDTFLKGSQFERNCLRLTELT